MNRKYFIAAAVFIIIFVVGFAAIKLRPAQSPPENLLTPTPTVALPTVSPDVVVELTSKNGNREVILKISGVPSNITSIEYELTYMTGAGLPKGVLGKITLAAGENEVTRDDIVLGTCSSGHCVYDTGVTSIDLALKFNSDSGASVFTKTYSL